MKKTLLTKYLVMRTSFGGCLSDILLHSWNPWVSTYCYEEHVQGFHWIKPDISTNFNKSSSVVEFKQIVNMSININNLFKFYHWRWLIEISRNIWFYSVKSLHMLLITICTYSSFGGPFNFIRTQLWTNIDNN